MFGIGHFFSKIQNSFTKEVMVRSVIKEAIKKKVGVDIPIESISFKSSTIILSGVSQAIRSAIFIKKQSIIKEITETQTIREVTDIR